MQILTELSGQSRFKGGGEAREIWRKNEGFMGRTAGEGLRKDLIKTSCIHVSDFHTIIKRLNKNASYYYRVRNCLRYFLHCINKKKSTLWFGEHHGCPPWRLAGRWLGLEAAPPISVLREFSRRQSTIVVLPVCPSYHSCDKTSWPHPKSNLGEKGDHFSLKFEVTHSSSLWAGKAETWNSRLHAQPLREK